MWENKLLGKSINNLFYLYESDYGLIYIYPKLGFKIYC